MESFEDVAKLETAAVRELFARGRPEQRVWAVWALALRTGGLIGIAVAAHADPDPGVRRTMAVMLASHGELDLLVALARHDPQPVVRESAIQLVTRLAVQGALPAAVVLEAARSDPPARAGVLAAIDRGAPAFLVELALDLLRRGTASEQADAFEALLRTGAPELARLARTWLELRPDPRDAIARMVRIGGEYAVACELAGAPQRLREAALHVMHAPSWPVVEQLVADDAELLLAVVREGRIDVPITALARTALDGHAGPLVARLTHDLAVLDAPSSELRPLLPLLDRHYGEWIAALERELFAQPVLAASTDDDATARTIARDELVALRAQIRRLMR